MALMGLALLSCQSREEAVEEVVSRDVNKVFYAEMEQVGSPAESKVYVDDQLRIRWHANDRVSIFDKYTYNDQYAFQGETGANSGSFALVPENQFVTGNVLPFICAVYPYDKENTISDDGEVSLTLPAVQTLVEKGFAPGVNTMVSVSEDNHLLFKNAGGYLAVKLYGEGVSVSSITLKGNNHEKLAGAAIVKASLEEAPVLVMAEDAAEELTLRCVDPVALGATAEDYTEFWFVLPPTEFTQGLTITVVDSSRHYFVKSTDGSISITRNHLSRLAPVEVLPSGEVLEPDGSTVFYGVTEGNSTKVHLSDNFEFVWDAGDRVSFFDRYTYNWPYLYQGNTSAVAGNFKSEPFDAIGSGHSLASYYAVYPYAEETRIDETGEISLVLPEQQQYAAGKLGEGAITMVAVSDDTNLEFKNLGGCVKFSLKGNGVSVSSISIKGNNGEKISGPARVIAQIGEDPVLEMSEGAGTKVMVVCPEPVVLNTIQDTEFWLSLPPTTFEQGFTITVNGPDGSIFEKKSAARSFTISRNRIISMGSLSVVYTYSDYEGPVQGSSAWSLIGNLSCIPGNDAWATDWVAVAEDFCYVVRNVWLSTSDQFKFRKDKSWDVNRGADCNYEPYVMREGVSAPVIEHGKNLAAPYDGIFDIWYHPGKEAILLCAAGSEPNWSAIASDHYLTFISEGTSAVCLGNNGGNAPTLYYSYDAKNWTLWDYTKLSFTNENPLYICGDNPNGFSYNNDQYSSFSTSGSPCHIEGSVMSLLSFNRELTKIPREFCFINLFSTFCPNLVSAPDLPATTLMQACYYNMFSGCTSLVTAPELPATAVYNYCYWSMFKGCTSLVNAPELPATTLGPSCYYDMFNGCTSLVTAPELPATKLALLCYAGMFNGCTSLVNAPELPATTLAEECYGYMFNGCTSLVAAPELPAATLTPYCYTRMFYGCTSLNYVKCLAATIRAQHCLDEWLNGVSETGTFVKYAGISSWPTGASGIPAGWTVANAEGISEQLYIDGVFSDWDTLDPTKISEAIGDADANRPVLQKARVYADAYFIYVYFEYDKDAIIHESGVEHVPFHCFINTDGDAATGGFSDLFSDACADIMLEGFIYPDGDVIGAYDPGVWAWTGKPNGSGWGWDSKDLLPDRGLCQGAGIEGKYELLIDRTILDSIGFPVADTFSIGFEIEQGWNAVGVLPNAAPSNDNPSGIAPSLRVVTDR